jgi:hypothetical protein
MFCLLRGEAATAIDEVVEAVFAKTEKAKPSRCKKVHGSGRKERLV